MLSKLLTERKAAYKVVAAVVIVSAWSYVLSEIYKYEMDAHYSLTPRRVEEVEPKHLIEKAAHIEAPEMDEEMAPEAVAFGSI